ncbi:MAG: TolC family protein [Pirellulaceae bacterium]|nr:TolC family protein [Pirellulaceae bacterium]
MKRWLGGVLTIALVLAGLQPEKFARAEKLFPVIFPEQRRIAVRDPSELPPARIPDVPPPPTVTAPRNDDPQWILALDDAVRIALSNSEVVRVLAGVTAASSGVTIYDPAISNTVIDQEQARFDPQLTVRNDFNRFESPLGPDATGRIVGEAVDDYNLNLDLSKTTVTGGAASLRLNTNPRRFDDDRLFNPLNRSFLELGYTQPLLQGGGQAANRAPIVLARIDTERSYFQLKDSVQELVRGTIAAYWDLVFARVDVWARRQQVEQGEFALRFAEAEARVGRTSGSEVAPVRSALARFRAGLLSAEGNLLDREAALRNILGIPPSDNRRIVPFTPPRRNRLEPNWQGILELASERRPDIIELKLILEADQQRLLLARNESQPRLDAQALYRWNGLEGELPAPDFQVSSRPGEFTDWTLGVNFSVPLGLRRERAGVRRQELLLARDRANLDQGLHNAAHQLALAVRNVARSYEQYLTLRETREAARKNLEVQVARFEKLPRGPGGQPLNFLDVRVAISDWGDAVSAEAQALLQYNTDLATLERETGTVLETHGVRFYEERFAAVGPLGRWHPPVAYPRRLPPTENADRYPAGNRPAEESFDLQTPTVRRGDDPARRLEELPRPAPGTAATSRD